MTYDGIDVLTDFHAQERLGYPLLGDENAEHVIAFGVLNENYEPGHRAYGIPHPGIVHITPDGTVAAKFAVPDYRRRPPLEAVLKAVSADAQR